MPPRGCATAAREPLSVPPSVSAYCRQARRLRGTLARQPARMHRKLRELASTQPAPAASAQPAPSHAREFAEQVEAALEGSVLRYARRRALISKAKTLGISDFQASLLIAAVQHERRRAGAVGVPVTGHVAGRRSISSVAPLLVVIAVESLVALGVWQVFLG